MAAAAATHHSQQQQQSQHQQAQQQQQAQIQEHQQQQQQQQHRQHLRHRQQHLQLHQLAVGAVFALLLAAICVNGQIDGYTPGVDYPIYETVPKGLSFSCQGRMPGYYADIETRCQVWHWCLHSGHQYSFLCPNGTVFNQAVRVCDWWSNVNCPASEQLYRNNEELYRPNEQQPERNI